MDILKAIQLLPGVQSAGEGNAGFYVRGGGPDQNLIMLDDAVVYNTGHLFGFFSIFNGDAIKNVSLIKGGMPAQYGGRLSSVLDVTMKEGNINKFQTEGGIGLIASRFSVQGPIKKEKASFIVSARRTYIDALVKPFVSKSSSFYGSGYYFYDLNAKVNYRFSDKDRLYLSGYFGRDVFDFRNSKRSLIPIFPGEIQRPRCAGTTCSTAACLLILPLYTMIIILNFPPSRKILRLVSLPVSGT